MIDDDDSKSFEIGYKEQDDMKAQVSFTAGARTNINGLGTALQRSIVLSKNTNKNIIDPP